MTENEIRRRFPNASAAFLRKNSDSQDRAAGLPASQPKPDPRKSLDRVLPGKAAGGEVPARRAFICFHIYCIQPRDWDNSFTKPLQDLLVEIGVLDGDSWAEVQGIVIPHKVKTKKTQRTEIEIWYDQSPKDRPVFPLPTGC